MPKNPGLEYQASEPAFLRRMKAGQAAQNGKHDVQIPRARGGIGRNERLRMDGEEGEDEPVMLDEGGNIVSIEQMQDMTKDAAERLRRDEIMAGSTKLSGKREASEPQKSADTNIISGLAKKRKAAKVIGDDQESDLLSPANVENHENTQPSKTFQQSTKDLQHAVQENKEAIKKDKEDGLPLKKQKRNKIKLSFDDPE